MQGNYLIRVGNDQKNDGGEILRHDVEERLREKILDRSVDCAIVAAMIVDEPARVPEKGIDEDDEQVQSHTRVIQNGHGEV